MGGSCVLRSGARLMLEGDSTLRARFAGENEESAGPAQQHLLLTEGAPCAPPRKTLMNHGLAQPHPRPIVSVPKFYLHYFPHFEGVRECFIRAIGGNDGEDDLDRYVLPNVAEHLTDFRLLAALRSLPQRAVRMADADVHVVAATLGLSYHASALHGNPCGTHADHQVRMEHIVEHLESMGIWSKEPERFIFVDTDWDWDKHVMGERLAHMVKEKGAILATVDSVIASFGGVVPGNVVVVPYKAHYELENVAEVADTDHMEEAGRNVSVAFHGSLRRRNSGQLRSGLIHVLKQLPNVSVENQSFYGISPTVFAGVTSRTAAVLTRSRFCVVPAGDTPSSRRLFDSLAAGCVPIIFNSLKEIAPSLPFRHTVDWSEVAIFAGSMECTVNQVRRTSAWLRRLLSPGILAEEAIAKMRLKGRSVFRDVLSYRHAGPAAALLVEVAFLRGGQHIPNQTVVATAFA